jgi:hydroxymethylglutaryl-CoA lyase
VTEGKTRAGMSVAGPRIDIVEVALRDGLQNEPVIVATADKVRLAQRLVAAGARRVEAVSFAHPKAVPAMADAEAVMEGVLATVPSSAGVSWAGLVLNARGLGRALACGVNEVNSVVCASDEFSQRNQRMSTQDAMKAAIEVTQGGREAGLFTTITIATAFGCPFAGEVAPTRVLDLAAEAIEAGVDEVCLADTIGVGVPAQVDGFAGALARVCGQTQTALRFHFHNTRNTGYANAWAAVRSGAVALDASVGGIGGCPFAPKATGNIATDDLVYLLNRSGVTHGYDLDALIDLTSDVAAMVRHDTLSLLPRAGVFPSTADGR